MARGSSSSAYTCSVFIISNGTLFLAPVLRISAGIAICWHDRAAGPWREKAFPCADLCPTACLLALFWDCYLKVSSVPSTPLELVPWPAEDSSASCTSGSRFSFWAVSVTMRLWMTFSSTGAFLGNGGDWTCLSVWILTIPMSRC